jgi:hypothetical protein
VKGALPTTSASEQEIDGRAIACLVT